MNSIENGIVYRSFEKNGVTFTEYVDMQYHTEITYDGERLITEVYDYLGNVQPFVGKINFIINGVSTPVSAISGKASIRFTPTGYDTITTNQEGMRNGELVIGSPPVVPSELDLIKQQLQQVILTVGDMALGG